MSTRRPHQENNRPVRRQAGPTVEPRRYVYMQY